MSRQLVVGFYRHFISRPVVILTSRIDQRYAEIVHLPNLPGVRFPICGGYSGPLRPPVSRPEESRPHCGRLREFVANVRQISGRGMALRAVRIEEGLAFCRISRSLIPDGCVRLAVAAAIGRQLDLEMQVFSYFVDLVVTQARERRHPGGSTLFDYRPDFVRLLIMKHHYRTDQVGPLRAPGIRPVASGAVFLIKRLTQLCCGRVRSRPESKERACRVRAATA